jgi:sodium-dependent dicarboxylate transporter 2/3/5
MNFLLRIFSGPIVFFLLYLLPIDGLPVEGRLVISCFGWMITWWITHPVPWSIASLIPLILFPVLGLLGLTETVRLYGQSIFFWIWGCVLMGYAMERQGLAQRFSLWFLSLPLVSGSTRRMLFGFMLVTGLLSSHVSDAAAVAMMIPVALSLASYVRKVTRTDPQVKTNIGSFLVLGAMYAAAAGGIATIAGVPHNPLGVALLEELTGRTLTWFQWMMVGGPIFLVALLVFFFILNWLLPPEIATIPGGDAYLRQERAKLGPMKQGEWVALFIFLVMVALFMAPALVSLLLGNDHTISVWIATSLSPWTVPPLILVLLFSVPADWKSKEMILPWKEAVDHTPWNAMFMCVAGVAVSSTLSRHGFVEWMGGNLGQLGIGTYTLPFLASGLMSILTNIIAGAPATTLLGSILIPAAEQVNFNPASMAMILPNMAVGFMLPWAGAVAGTTFASGEVDLKRMIRIGLVAELSLAGVVAVMHILFASIL